MPHDILEADRARPEEIYEVFMEPPVERICSAEVPMPYARHMEQAALPQAETIVATVKRMVHAHA